MSGIAVGWAHKHGPRSKRLKAALVCLASHTNALGENAFPGVKTIADETGYSRASVIAALKELTDLGLIEPTAQGGGRGHTTVYRMRWETVQTVDPFRGQRVQSTGVKGPDYDAHIRKNDRENARQSHEGCEHCKGEGFVWIEATHSARPCPGSLQARFVRHA